MKKSTIGVLIFVGAVLLIAVIAAGSSSSSTLPDVEYNYKIEIVDSFIDENGHIETPSTGDQFVILTYHIYNERYSSSISTNSMTWQMKIVLDDLEYPSSSWYTYLHPGYRLVDIPKGSDAACVQVFEVPTGHQASEMGVTLNAIFTYAKVEYNPDLEV